MRHTFLNLALVTTFLGASGLSTARAQEFKPFGNVTSVCPKCPAYGLDKIQLKDGQEIAALIVAENPLFIVVRRYGEFRAIGRNQITSIQKSSDAGREADHDDQVLMKDGLVVSGKIVREREETGMLEIQIPPNKSSMIIYRSLVQAIFKSGKQVYSAGAP